GVNDAREIAQIDILANGDLIAIVGANSNPRVFGQQFASDGRFLVQLRSADASPVFVKDVGNCWMTAVKAKPGGGYFVGGFTLGSSPRVGGDALPILTNQVFIAQFSSGLDWVTTGDWNGFSDSIREIRTSGLGPTLRIWAVGDASHAMTFGGKVLGQAGVYLAMLDGSGAVLDARVEVPDASTAAFAIRPSGGAYLAAKKLVGGNSLSRLDGSGAALWTLPLASGIVSISSTDEPYEIGSQGDSAFIASLDSSGSVKWSKNDASRSPYSGTSAAVLADGRLAVCGVTSPSGIFIDDFFLRDFDKIERTYYGAYVATFDIVSTAKPVFRKQPHNQKLAIQGENVTLHSEIYSTAAVSFRWFKNGTLIPNQFTPDLLLPNVQAADSAAYYVEAQNANGVTKSSSVDVVVNSVAVSTVGGTDASSAFTTPVSPVLLPDGSILVADSAQNQIKRVSSSGVSVFAGAGDAGLADGAAGEAKFSAPTGLAFESRYEGPIVYVADHGNNSLRRLFLSADSTSVSRVDSINPKVNSLSAAATLDGLRFAFLGADNSAAIWEFDEGNLSSLIPIYPLGGINGIALDARANIYASDAVRNEIRRTSPEHDTTVFAQGLNAPVGIAFDEDENLFVAEKGSHTIQKVSPSGTKTIVAGVSGVSGLQNGGSSQALFSAPEGICFRNGSLIVADTGNHCLREIKFTPLNGANPGDAQLQFTIGNTLSISVNSGASASFAIESSSQIGANAQWQNEGTVSANAGQGLSLAKPTGTRFYRARQLP
ncbi:MAG: immunoglobulin domain-containing protein, partial [Limisphaerales bacterium]